MGQMCKYKNAQKGYKLILNCSDENIFVFRSVNDIKLTITDLKAMFRVKNSIHFNFLPSWHFISVSVN